MGRLVGTLVAGRVGGGTTGALVTTGDLVTGAAVVGDLVLTEGDLEGAFEEGRLVGAREGLREGRVVGDREGPRVVGVLVVGCPTGEAVAWQVDLLALTGTHLKLTWQHRVHLTPSELTLEHSPPRGRQGWQAPHHTLLLTHSWLGWQHFSHGALVPPPEHC